MNQRQEKILLSLKKLGFLTRDQLMRMHDLKSKRNANRILSEMKSYLSNFREGYDTIYYLNKEGREYIGANVVRKKNMQIHHYLMRSEFYIFSGMPENFETEIEVSDGCTRVICDAWFWKGERANFLEVDNEQSMVENRKKIERYKKIYQSRIFQDSEDYGYFPKLNWLTTSDYRKRKIISYCSGLPYSVFTLKDIK